MLHSSFVSKYGKYYSVITPVFSLLLSQYGIVIHMNDELVTFVMKHNNFTNPVNIPVN